MTNEFMLLTNLNNACLLEWSDSVELEGVTCPIDPGHQRPGRRLTPLSVKLPSGKHTDLMWTWYSDLLLNAHAAQIFSDNHLSGYELVPAEIMGNGTNGAPPELWEFKVTGWAGAAPPESGIELEDRCAACKHSHYSPYTHPEKLINKDQWDGSDFFIVWPLPRYIFVTERVVQVVRENHLTGAAFENIEELKVENTGFSPGLLEYWFSESRIASLQHKPK